MSVSRIFRRHRPVYRGALELIPGNHDAQRGLNMCIRRLKPELPGFIIAGNDFDSPTGLPRRVRIVDLDASMLLVSPGNFDIGSDELPDSPAGAYSQSWCILSESIRSHAEPVEECDGPKSQCASGPRISGREAHAG